MKDQIIQHLKEAEGFLSGEDISRRLKISRAGIWKNIEELRKEGYDIQATPHLGYQLKDIPNKLYPREIQYGLATQTFGQVIHYHPEIVSTMDEAYDLARKGSNEGELVIAEAQLKGRGRLQRTWVSPKNQGLYFSIILRPKLNPVDLSKITLMAGVALCDAIFTATGIQTDIKWPNDLLHEGKKVAGILTEINAEMDQVHYCILGVGINVNTALNQIPENATSLKVVGGTKVNRIDLLQHILRRMEYWYRAFERQDFSVILDFWKANSCTMGRDIHIGDVHGKVIDLDEYGALLIQKKNGEVVRQLSGDVHYV